MPSLQSLFFFSTFMTISFRNRLLNIDSFHIIFVFVITELMLLGFISLLLTVTQGPITKICIPDDAASHMLPCKMPTSHVSESYHRRYPPQTVNSIGKRLLLESSTGQHCAQVHIFLLTATYMLQFQLIGQPILFLITPYN